MLKLIVKHNGITMLRAKANKIVFVPKPISLWEKIVKILSGGIIK